MATDRNPCSGCSESPAAHERATVDRRAFLRRSGLTLGAGAVASQLPFNMIGSAEAAKEPATKTEVKRTAQSKQ